MNAYKPFLISEFKTGLFNYLQPWIRPTEAWQPLQDAFVYRGTVQSRYGETVFGYMTYEDNNIAVGNGGKTYAGTLAVHPIRPGSFAPSDGIETFSDNGMGVLTGNTGGTGTINYTTGAWTLDFNANVANDTDIYGIYEPIPATNRPIMGIQTWTDETNGLSKLLVEDTRRAAVYNGTTKVFDPIDSISQQLWQGDGTTTSISFSTGWSAVTPYTNVWAPFSITVTDGTSTIVDDGSGNLSSSGNLTGGTVSYSAGTISLTFGSAPATTVSIIMTALLSGDYFTGNESNFFNSVNWLGILYLTNNKDPITTFDGTNLARPAFPITQANQLTYTNNIGNCLNVAVYKNRLLVESPTLINNGFGNGLFAQSIRWSAIPIPGSAIFTPTNLVADVAGNGGELSATTDDFLQASQLLRDQVIVFFSNSTWIFRYTGSDFAPFRFDRINASKTTSAPYASIDYDERVTSMGSKGLIACDGVNVQRYDVSIIDQFLDINQKAFFQCFGIRFDTTNQSWMLYPSVSNDALTSDTILVYNFLEQTWSTFDIALSCVGLYVVSQDAAWQDFAIGGPMPLTWEQADFAWDSYLLQDLSPNLLGGGFTGVVYQMNSGETDLDPVTGDELAINYSMTTARLNPFVGVGQKVQFGYIDFYYAINEDAIATITFYTDNTSAPSATRQLTFDGPTNSSQAVKRVYINIVGEFLQFNINKYQPLPDEDPLLGNGPIQILGMVLWARPAGRWTP